MGDDVGLIMRLACILSFALVSGRVFRVSCYCEKRSSGGVYFRLDLDSDLSDVDLHNKLDRGCSGLFQTFHFQMNNQHIRISKEALVANAYTLNWSRSFSSLVTGAVAGILGLNGWLEGFRKLS